MSENKDILVGAHTSIAGGVSNAIYRGKDINATAIQIFTSNQRQWISKPIDDDEAKNFISAKNKTGINVILSHSSYLINLGATKKNILHMSKKAFIEEIERCKKLEIDYLVFHPGSATTSSEEECLNTIVESLLSFEKEIIENEKTRLLLETTAGQGTNVGYKFEHLGYIIEKVKNKIPIGVCLDTCHIFSAGYDIRTKEQFLNTFENFSKHIGLKHLYAFHLNDSKTEFNSRKDRHESLGSGSIGLEPFKYLMKDKRFEKMPKILETPKDEIWIDEINLLKNLAGEK
ncbi:MAG: deoxyribonuclease IV [Parachlamydiales bacterium]|nr:deoxyribonuclease IV [Parachlamydiales bacterium]